MLIQPCLGGVPLPVRPHQAAVPAPPAVVTLAPASGAANAQTELLAMPVAATLFTEGKAGLSSDGLNALAPFPARLLSPESMLRPSATLPVLLQATQPLSTSSQANLALVSLTLQLFLVCPPTLPPTTTPWGLKILSEPLLFTRDFSQKSRLINHQVT